MKKKKEIITGQIEGCPYPQWTFEQSSSEEEEGWTPQERAVIEALLRPDMQKYYDKFGMHADHPWRFWKTVHGEETRFIGRKIMWESGSISGQSIEELARSLSTYLIFPSS